MENLNHPYLIANSEKFWDLIEHDSSLEIKYEGTKWAEGPAWNFKTNQLIWSDVPQNKMYCLNSDSSVSIFKENSNWRQSTVVIKSTLPVGFCDEVSNKYGMENIVYNPEFLTQRTALSDFRNQQEIYLAGNPTHTATTRNLYELFFANCENENARFFETEKYTEFELLKLARNSFYGVKVSYCNQLYNLCKKINIDYDTFREHFTRCEWVEDQHTHVPGPDGKLGFGGKCLPKDATGLHGCFKEHGIDFKMLKTSLEFNKTQRNK